MGVVLIDFVRGNFVIIAPKMQHIVFYASFSMSYVFLYLVGLAQVISFLFWQIVKFKLNILVDRKTHKGL